MPKKLIEMTEQELGDHIGHLCRGYEVLSIEPPSPEEENDHYEFLNSLKKDLVAAVYFARQRKFQKALDIGSDDLGGECPEEYAKWCLEDLMFANTAIRKYNELMKKGDIRQAFDIVDKLKEIGLLPNN